MASNAEKKRNKKRQTAKGWKAKMKAVHLMLDAERKQRAYRRQQEIAAGFKVVTFTDAGFEHCPEGKPRAADLHRGYLGHDDHRAADPYATERQVAFEVSIVRDGGGRAWEHPAHFVTDGGVMRCRARRRYPEREGRS